LCLLFGIGIGLLMALLFWRDDASHDAQTDTPLPTRPASARPRWACCCRWWRC
jgi:hypothetical protein